METDRFSPAATRAAAVLLAGLLLAADATGQGISFRFKRKPKSTVQVTSEPVASESVAAALAAQVQEVRARFDTNRRALRTVPDPGGEPAHPRQEVTRLIARTGEDLDQAIQRVQEPGLDGLRAWAAEEIRNIQGELAAPSGQNAALSTPQAIARIASLGAFPEPESVIAAAPQPETISAATSNRLLDQVGEVIGCIFLLADQDDLEVDLWVGSTPGPARFSFWSQGRLQGATPTPQIIHTNGRKDRVLRGLYAYRAALSDGAVTELVQYPNPAAVDRSERLDLVKGSSFFCCRFGEQSCHHVASEKECRP